MRRERVREREESMREIWMRDRETLEERWTCKQVKGRWRKLEESATEIEREGKIRSL